MRRLLRPLFLLLALLPLLSACSEHHRDPAPRQRAPQADSQGLPPEALETLSLIRRGGPFPYRKDGSTFHNREKRLPLKGRGYYREYTVPTPGERTRGARRIVTGGKPPTVYYYTADHYRSFRRIEPGP